jgi:fructose-bisphosphate aldolase class II
MPIATPRSTPRCSTAPRPALRLPGDQRDVLADAQRRAAGLRRGRSDGIVQVSTGGAEYLSGPTVKDMVTGAVALAEFAHEVAKKYPVNIALHTDHCPKDKLDGFVRPLLAISRSGSRAARSRCSSRTCGTARRCRSTRTCRSPRSCSPRRARPRSSWRSRSASSAARRTASPTRSTRSSTPPRGRPGHGRGARHRREGPLHAAATFGNVHGVYKPGNVKLRPEILKEIQDAVGAKSARREAVRPGLPRRLRLAARGDPRGARLRRGEDEHRHRHPVRVHPPGRRPHVQQLRRRAQGRRRGRQQEGLRPARLGQAAEAGMAKRVVEACENLRGRSRPTARRDRRASGRTPRPRARAAAGVLRPRAIARSPPPGRRWPAAASASPVRRSWPGRAARAPAPLCCRTAATAPGDSNRSPRPGVAATCPPARASTRGRRRVPAVEHVGPTLRYRH